MGLAVTLVLGLAPQAMAQGEISPLTAPSGLEQPADLQQALAHFGHYTGAIDGRIGPATRAAIAAWQEARGNPPTGRLTPEEEQALLAQWQGDLDALGLAQWVDAEFGLRAILPLGLVAYRDHLPPFARFTPKDIGGPEILLFSQDGDARRLAALPDVIAALDVMPEGMERRREAQSFAMEGQDATRRAYVTMRLEGARIIGLIALWPQDQDARLRPVLGQITASLTPAP